MPVDAPLALCEQHLVLAADWAGRENGVTDLLPVPCVLCGSRVGVRYPSGWVCAVCEWRAGDLIDHELPPPRIDVVYYLRAGDRVKIGTTSQPHRRFAAIWHDEVLAFERGDRRRERERHAQFAQERFERTEWFRTSDRLRAHVETLGGGTLDPWDLLLRWHSEALALQG